MPAVKYSHSYQYKEAVKEQKTRKSSYKTVPLKKEQPKQKTIPSKDLHKEKVTKLNFALLSVAGILTIIFIGIYSVVALSEAKLANLHSKISELNYENTDLENKLENVKSFYSVDNKVSSSDVFEKAKNVLEVNRVDAKMLPHSQPKTNNLNTVTGF